MVTRINPVLHLLQRSSKAERDLYHRELLLLKLDRTPTDAQKKNLLTAVWLAVNQNREITQQERAQLQL